MYSSTLTLQTFIFSLCCSAISDKIGEINSLQNSPHQVQLRKENRIRTIHSSLAIENNSLSLEQITEDDIVVKGIINSIDLERIMG